MSPLVLLAFLVGYFLILFAISHFTSGKSSNATFFTANKNSKWYLVAFGMIGTALSGVTFISVPGAVGSGGFSYFQFVLGNAVGFIIIATVLLPLYYRLHLVSIYTYLEKRLGYWSYKSGAMLFLVSRTIGSAFRLYLVAIVLQKFIFDAWHVPFLLTIVICLLLIWAYTHKGGLKTIIITDTLQTVFLLLSVVFSIYYISQSLGLNLTQTFETVKESSYSKIFFFENFLGDKRHFLKQFISGIFVTIAMTGLDQDLMQKNLSMKSIGEAKTNMLTFTTVFVVMNIFFLGVGALLYIYAGKNGINVAGLKTPDHLYPEIALNHLGLLPGLTFMLGLTAATFATTDSALTALTTSFCIDFLHFDKKEGLQTSNTIRQRNLVHLGFSVLIAIVVMVFKLINDESVVTAIFTAAGYTYGPLLGLFSFGMLTRRQVADKAVPYICLAAPVLTWLISLGTHRFFGYALGFELIIINGLLTFLMLFAFSQAAPLTQQYEPKL